MPAPVFRPAADAEVRAEGVKLSGLRADDRPSRGSNKQVANNRDRSRRRSRSKPRVAPIFVRLAWRFCPMRAGTAFGRSLIQQAGTWPSRAGSRSISLFSTFARSSYRSVGLRQVPIATRAAAVRPSGRPAR